VVQAHIVKLDPFGCDTQQGRHRAVHQHRNVAEPHLPHPGATRQGLGNQSGRIGEVYHPGVRAVTFNCPGNLQQGGQVAQRTGKSPRSHRFLADAIEGQGDGFILQTHPVPADPDLGDHKIGSGQPLVEISFQCQFRRMAMVTEHSARQGPHHFQSLGIDIHQ